MAIDCHNLSRVRDTPTAGVRRARDVSHPEGLPDLPAELQKEVEDANGQSRCCSSCSSALLRRGA
eukprot:743893-Lingulodinium_polyedra.AAC.1